MAELPPKTADLVDAYGAELQVCELQMRNLGGAIAFCGPVRTLKVFEDNALLKQTLSKPGNGAVLVVDGGGSLRCALVGDVIAGIGVANGWAGLVIHGAVRDSEELAGLTLGVKALGTTPRVSGKTGAGQADIPVSFGNVTFHPGAWLAADPDGVVIRAEAPSA